MTDSDPVPKNSFWGKVNAAKGLILALAALVAALGSWLKPQDQTATKNSYDWTSKRIEEMSATDVQMRQDLVGIRNYLEGYVQAQRGQGVVTPAAAPVAAAREESGSGFGSGAGRLGGRSAVRQPPRRRSSPFAEVDAIISEPIPEPEPLPQIQAAPKAVEAPDFDQMAE